MSMFDLIGGNMGNMNVFAQAMQAAKNGESPQAFLSKLAESKPELQGIDFSNLENAAMQLCAKKGINPNSAMGSIMSMLNK